MLALAGSALPAVAASAARTDLLPPARRQQSVDRAIKLTAPPAIVPLPDTLPAPFNPPDFDRVDPEEQRPVMPPPLRPPSPGGGTAPGPTPQQQQAAANADREILDLLAPRIRPLGTLTDRKTGKPILTFPNNKRVGIGEGFLVDHENGQSYELAVVAIDRTTFTLRYHNEQVVLPIRASK